ncbi:MAG: helix-turn-helix transcriptional regulator [Marinilabiliaceae bacterium]|nr:helix-turn-helix transcriptional regulator [Marinilabiliaceae bacterium]
MNTINVTPRENQIWCLVVSGLVKKEIAAQLNRSEHTVSMTLRKLYAKLNVNKETELVREFFIYHGLVCRDDIKKAIAAPFVPVVMLFFVIAIFQLFTPGHDMRRPSASRTASRSVRSPRGGGRKYNPETDYLFA